jgi:uncharacterized membrane protein YhhN
MIGLEVQGGGTRARYFVAAKSLSATFRLPRQSWLIHLSHIGLIIRAMRTLPIRISIILALFYLLAISVDGLWLVFAFGRTAFDLLVVLKVGSVAAVVIFVVRAKQREPLLIAALTASLVGDFLLVPKQLGPLGESNLFLAGLAAFLLAHCCYITLFSKNLAHCQPAPSRRFSIALVVAALWFLLSRLWPSLGGMRLPVVIYALALSTMVIMAQLSRFSFSVALGTLSFLASDAMLAISHFSHPFTASRPLVWATYYTAQFFICTGVLRATPASAIKKAPLRRGA